MFGPVRLLGTLTDVISRTRQRVVTLSGVAVAAIALSLGIAYQGERLPDDRPVVVGGDPSGAVPASVAAAQAGITSTVPANPVEGFLPRSGEASACREPVGVDLITGYAATLTINGITIAPEEMNVVLDEDGQPTREITASRSLGQFTFGPEDDCPNGRVLRPTGNVLEACVYRVEEGPDSCEITRNEFDVL